MSLNMADMTSRVASAVQANFDLVAAAPMVGAKPTPSHSPHPGKSATPKPAPSTNPPAQTQPAQPVVQGRAQDPNAQLSVQSTELHKSPSLWQQLWGEKGPAYDDVKTTVTNSAKQEAGTIEVNGKDGSIDLSDGTTHMHVSRDGSAMISTPDHGTWSQVRNGEVIQVGDAKVRFNFAFPDDSATLGISKKSNTISNIEVMAGNDAPQTITGSGELHEIKIEASQFKPLQGKLSVTPDALGPQSDEPLGTNAMTSAPHTVTLGNGSTAIADPAVRLNNGALYALGQPGTPGGQLAPDAFTLNGYINGPYSAFTSVLDPAKIDTQRTL